MNHTQGPWKMSNIHIRCQNNYLIATCFNRTQVTAEENGKRIVACINAMEGIENPEGFVESFHELKKQLLETEARHQEALTALSMLQKVPELA